MQVINTAKISIHALREEGDYNERLQKHDFSYFNPRPPRGGRLGSPTYSASQSFISIHALREEGDWVLASAMLAASIFQSTPSARRATSPPKLANRTTLYFNPRPPRGGRRNDRTIGFSNCEFQSTPSARRATEGGSGYRLAHQDFNPRPPRGGRQQKRRKIRHVCSIIHTCAQFEKELYKGSGEMQNKSC